MATSFTRFELQIPLFSDGTAESDAVNTFESNVLTLAPFIAYDAYIHNTDLSITQVHIIYGLITVAQQTTALGYLNTLNTALGTSVLCTTNTVVSQP